MVEKLERILLKLSRHDVEEFFYGDGIGVKQLFGKVIGNYSICTKRMMILHNGLDEWADRLESKALQKFLKGEQKNVNELVNTFTELMGMQNRIPELIKEHFYQIVRLERFYNSIIVYAPKRVKPSNYAEFKKDVIDPVREQILIFTKLYQNETTSDCIRNISIRTGDLKKNYAKKIFQVS